MTLNNWGPAAIIVFGYIVGFYFQNKRIDDINHRFDDLYRYLDLRFSQIERRLRVLEERLGVKQ